MAHGSPHTFGQFDEDGFVIVNQAILPLDLIRKARERVGQVMQGEFDTGLPHWGSVNLDDPGQLQRIAQIHVCDQAIHQLVTHPQIGEIIARHTGAKQVKIWGTQLYAKPPGSTMGGHVGWHRDSQHIPFYNNGVMTLWIPLAVSDHQSGPLTYLRGSHKTASFEQPAGAQEQNLDLEKLKHQSSSKEVQWEEVETCVPEGGFSIHHWDLIHGSATNQSNQARYAISVGIATDELALIKDPWGYDYHAVLDNPFYCPILYQA